MVTSRRSVLVKRSSKQKVFGTFFGNIPFMRNVQNGQTYHVRNLAVFTPQDFESIFGHFST